MRTLVAMGLGLALLAGALVVIQAGVSTSQWDNPASRMVSNFASDYLPSGSLIPWPRVAPLLAGIGLAVVAGAWFAGALRKGR